MEDYPGDQLRPSRGGEVRGTGVRSRSLAALGMRREGVQRRRAGQAPPLPQARVCSTGVGPQKPRKTHHYKINETKEDMKSPLQGVLVDGEVAMTLEEAMEKVWRAALVEGAAEVELDGKKFAVRETPRKRLRELNFEFGASRRQNHPGYKTRIARTGAESKYGIAVGATGEKGSQGDAVSLRGAIRGECGGRQRDVVWRKEKSETMMREAAPGWHAAKLVSPG